MEMFRFPVKCMACGLHFNVYSWYAEWGSQHRPWCPECGQQAALILGQEAMDSEIFMHVSAVVTPTTTQGASNE